jgi:D-methionine transport system substrate-binding protein
MAKKQTSKATKVVRGIVLVAAVAVVAALGVNQIHKSNTSKKEADQGYKTVKVGVIGEDNKPWDYVKKELKKEHINLKIISFSDYNQPNDALVDGSIDLNSFQHTVFLEGYNKEHKSDLVSIGNTVVVPLNIFSDKYKKLSEIPDGAKVAISNDPTNGGRALHVLASAKLITLKDPDNLNPTVHDIKTNPKHIKIIQVDALQTAKALKDVDASVINSSIAYDAGIKLDTALFTQPVDKSSRPYVNIIVSTKKNENNATFKKIVKAYQSAGTKKVIQDEYHGAEEAAWVNFGAK